MTQSNVCSASGANDSRQPCNDSELIAVVVQGKNTTTGYIPMSRSRICRCGAIVIGRCPRCDRRHEHKKTTTERGYGSDWQKLSERKRAEDPLCENCLKTDRVEPATEVHHIQPIATNPDLRLEWSNLMSVCGACHKLLESHSG